MELSGLGKLGAIVATLVIGADLYGRWTQQAYRFDFLGANPIGAATNAAQVQGAQTAAAQLAAAGVVAGDAATASLPLPPPGGGAPPGSTSLERVA